MANASSMPSRPINVEVNTRDLFACLITLRLKFPRRRRIHVKIRRSEISAGNHIYTPRAGGVYDHHGIYIGEDLGLVIHFQNSVDDKAALRSSIHRFGVCPDCGHHSGRSGVVLSCLDCFLRGGVIYRYEYGCRDASIPIDFMKWCTSADSDSRNTVIDRAKLLLTDGFGKYNLVRNNCEDFALFCKTGQHIRSGQIMVLLFQPKEFLDNAFTIYISHQRSPLSLIFFLSMSLMMPFLLLQPLDSSGVLLIPSVIGFAKFDALCRRRRKNWPLHCKRYLAKWKKRSTAGRICQPVSLRPC